MSTTTLTHQTTAPCWMQTIQKEGLYVSNTIIDQAKKLGNTVIHVWENEDILSHPITHIFIGVVFKCSIAYFCPVIAAIVPDYLLVSLPMFIERVRNSYKEALYLSRIQNLEKENRELSTQQRNMASQIDTFGIENKRLAWEKSQAVEEKALAEKKQEGDVLETSAVLIQRDQLLETNKFLVQERDVLQDQNKKLLSEKEQTVQEKRTLEEKYAQVSKEFAEARMNLELSGGYVELSHELSQLNNLYTQIVRRERQGEAAPALDSLISSYENNKSKLHAILQTAIDELPSGDSNRIILGEILRISQKEMQLPRTIIQAAHVSTMSN